MYDKKLELDTDMLLQNVNFLSNMWWIC